MKRIGFIAYEGFQSMAFAALSVFEYANAMLGEQVYDLEVISETGGLVRSSSALVVDSTPFGDASFDSVIVGGGVKVIEQVPPGLLRFMRSAPERSRRVCSICTGAFILAEAGLLDGKRATTHWLHGRELQARYPLVKVEEDRIFINEGAIWTSAGMTAGLDLALAMIEQDLNPELALSIARKLVIFHRRSGGQSQHSALLEMSPKSDPIQKALAYAKLHLQDELSVDDLAKAASLSPRQFSRVFRAETGQSPAKAVENLRLEAARWMLEGTRKSIDEVAEETGFADLRRMREAFLRTFGHPPQALRREARAERAIQN